MFAMWSWHLVLHKEQSKQHSILKKHINEFIKLNNLGAKNCPVGRNGLKWQFVSHWVMKFYFVVKQAKKFRGNFSPLCVKAHELFSARTTTVPSWPPGRVTSPSGSGTWAPGSVSSRWRDMTTGSEVSENPPPVFLDTATIFLSRKLEVWQIVYCFVLPNEIYSFHSFHLLIVSNLKADGIFA